MLHYTDHFLRQVPKSLETVLLAAMDRFQLGEMSHHGPSHWLTVLRHATLLADQTAGADLKVCQHFALLHDCERRNEGTDPEHGARAAVYVRELFQLNRLDINDSQMMLLAEACIYHASGRISSDPTIGVCWDADRLDLPRVGIGIDRKYLSTIAAVAML